jgi:RNA polymerase sigma-70 factor (ECF subfamily)
MNSASDLVGASALVSSEGEACIDWPAHRHATTPRVSLETELIRRAQAGSSQAYAELVRPHQPLAFHAAWVITRSSDDAEEALQEGLFKAYRALERFRVGEPFRPWLLRIVTNEAYTLTRGRARRSMLQLRARDAASEQWAPPPDDSAAAAQASAGLARALEALPERDRQTITCRYLLELSEEETAIALRCRRGTVKSRLSRALERLRALVESGEFEAIR